MTPNRGFKGRSTELHFRAKTQGLASRPMVSRRRGSKGLTAGAQLISLAVVLLLLLTSLGAVAGASPAPLASPLSDDFTHDTSLNANLWEISGPVALNFSNNNCPACSGVSLTPSFSPAGMEIADANGSSVVGAIQSVQSFAPPLTVTALVKGLVSNGHPFVFGISSQNASSGVQLTGNLNPDDCSADNNCGNPSTCGTPANSTIEPNQCFFGIYSRAGNGGGTGTWKKTPPLNLTPALLVVYNLTIAVNSSGTAQISVSALGQLLGQVTTQVGTGPFYIIIAQSEGTPVPGPGPNVAVWMSVDLTPSATISPPSSGSPSGVSPIEWALLLIVAIVALLAIVVVVRSRRRGGLTVTGPGLRYSSRRSGEPPFRPTVRRTSPAARERTEGWPLVA